MTGPNRPSRRSLPGRGSPQAAAPGRAESGDRAGSVNLRREEAGGVRAETSAVSLHRRGDRGRMFYMPPPRVGNGPTSSEVMDAPSFPQICANAPGGHVF